MIYRPVWPFLLLVLLKVAGLTVLSHAILGTGRTVLLDWNLLVFSHLCSILLLLRTIREYSNLLEED